MHLQKLYGLLPHQKGMQRQPSPVHAVVVAAFSTLSCKVIPSVPLSSACEQGMSTDSAIQTNLQMFTLTEEIR